MTEKDMQAVDDTIERKKSSMQPRFKSEVAFFNSMLRMIDKSNFKLPEYSSDARSRDTELIRLAKSESLLSGVIASAVSRDKNRGWLLSGPARQVSSFSRKFHGVHDGEGWRKFVSLNSEAWYTTNFGYISEIASRYKNGPVESLYNVDPTHCKLTGSYPTVATYHGGKKVVKLSSGDIIHGNSMPSILAKMKGVGFCAVERAMAYLRLAIGLNRHQLEKLGVKLPKGIILGKGIELDEWKAAFAEAEEDDDEKNRLYYEGVVALMSKNHESDLKIISLSEIPDNFQLKDFIDITMQAYALAFGYPVGEFWSIASGSFGRTGEMKEQQQQATAKGELDFALSFQEQLSTHVLPPSLDFQFDQRNDRGDLIKAEADRMAYDIITDAYHKGLEIGYKYQTAPESEETDGFEEPEEIETEERARKEAEREETSLISRDEARELMAARGLLPKEWTQADEDTATTDLQEVRDRLLTTPALFDVIRQNTSDPIISYAWNYKTDFTRSELKEATRNTLDSYYFPTGKIKILWQDGSELLRKRYW
jgi:hypothetical protein